MLIIGGSNAHLLKDRFGDCLEEFQINTPFGKSHKIRKYKHNNKEFYFLFRHGVYGYEITAPFVNYRANIFAAKKLGINRILSWTGPGAIDRKFEIGDLVIPHDIIDFTKKRDYTFFDNKGLGFIRMNPCFCPSIRESLNCILEGLNYPFHKEGIYICTEGPRLETAAEIRFFKMIGGQMVGMTLVPEAFLARELEMCYASICYITNYAESDEISYKEGELFEGTLPDEKKENVNKALALLPDIILRLLDTDDNCGCLCKKSMLRYKKAGKIGSNFEEWL